MRETHRFVCKLCEDKDAAEVNSWIREAVRLMSRAKEPFANSEVDYLDWVEDMCNHAEKVKLEERCVHSLTCSTVRYSFAGMARKSRKGKS